MKKILLKFALVFSFILLPVASFAQPYQGPCPDGSVILPDGSCPSSGSGIGDLLLNIQELLNFIVPILVALGVVYFVWGVVRFMIADTEEAKTKGKDTIIYGIIGFAVILGLWGLVEVVINTLNLSPGSLYAPSLAPIQVNADDSSCVVGENIQGLLQFGTCIINNSIIPLIFAIAVVMFIWGAVKFFIINADEEAQREQGKQFMIWGIIALTVMTAVWGLVGILGETFGIGGDVLPQVCPPNDPKCQ